MSHSAEKNISLPSDILQKQLEDLTREKLRLTAERDDAIRASMAKSRFLADMSHEIRTPLSSITGLTEILKESPETDEQATYFDTLGDAAEVLLNLINNILDLSKIEAGEMLLDETEVNLEDLLTSVASLMELKARKKKIELHHSIDPGLPTRVKADPVKLRQILTNLIANGINFTEVGSVTAQISRKENELLLCVQDTGIGIPEKSRQKIFMSFTQAEASTTRHHGGTGLGLSIVSSLVTLMGGKIWVESQEGVGSSFYVELPLRPAKDKKIGKKGKSSQLPAIKKTKADQDLLKHRLLIVEDEETMFELFETILEEIDVKPTFASNPKEALEVLEQEDFDTILSDFRLPFMTGIEMLQKIQSLGYKIPFVLMSGYGDKKMVLEGFRAGIFDVLEKPFTSEQMVEILERSLHQGGKLRSSRDIQRIERCLPEAKILIAEDSKENQFLLEVFLKNTPCKTEFAETGAAAFEKYKNGSFDLILMDMRMPEIDGYEATRLIREYELKNALPATPIIALTAEAFQNTTSKTLEAGCNSYLTKPVKKSVLLSTILKYCESSPIKLQQS